MRYFADKIASIFFQRAITQKRGIILSRKKICVSYFFMRNPYMKFQNSSIHGFKVMLCIKKRDERTDGRTHRRTDEQPRSNMPLQLLWSWGHNQEVLCYKTPIIDFYLLLLKNISNWNPKICIVASCIFLLECLDGKKWMFNWLFFPFLL